jgi:methyl-accepting chemotaxis protein
VYKSWSIASKILVPYCIGLAISFSVLYWIIIKYGLSGASNAKQIILGTVAVIFIIIMLGTWNISRVLVKPISRLSSYAQKMALGDMQFEMEIDNSREMRQLATSFQAVQRSINEMFSEVTMFENSISTGDLTSRADVGKYQGDFREIARGLNSIMDSTSSLVKSVRDTSELVSSASAEISSGAQILAKGATEQAASIQEISATVDSMTSFMKNTSNNAIKAEKLSEDVHSEAEAGSQNMNRLLTALNEINISSSNISKIIKNIEDIAFQTNILALNAAVEAARAGASGKGFAVVAAEVKNLASKSSEAAKQTNTLLNDSIVKARDGLKIGEAMHTTLGSIVTSVGNTVHAITEIAADAKNQADTVEQINIGLTQISSIVQNTTATAEESASNSEEMVMQASVLQDMVSHYQFLDDVKSISAAAPNKLLQAHKTHI